MHETSLRVALRQHTDDIHRRLDAAVGTFGNLDSYGAFVASSLRFRRMIEPAVAGGSWEPQLLVDDLRRDGEDLRLPDSEPGPPTRGMAGEAERLGALYVLEGSALGARILFERAKALGLSGERGARHLAKQVGEAGRWRRFVQFLDARADLPREPVLAGARSTFETALAVYARPR